MATVLRSLLVAVVALWAIVAAGQETPRSASDPVYPFWDNVATRAEQQLARPDNVTEDDLDALRKRMVTFREEFDTQRKANANRIANLESQIQALGPVPENGSEADEITAKRFELEQNLKRFEAPILVAEAAFQRAEGLISEIDRLLRDRQARKLLELGPSPLDPRNWPAAFADIGRIVAETVRSVRSNRGSVAGSEVRDRLPLVLLLLTVSLVVIAKGRTWSHNAVEYMRRLGGRGSGVWSFLASLLRILLPLGGIVLLTTAIRMANLLSPLVHEILAWLPIWGLMFLGFTWLSDRLFGRNDDDPVVPLPQEKRRTARLYMQVLALLFVLRGVMQVLFELEEASPETIAVVSFPFALSMGLVLTAFGAYLRRKERDHADQPFEDGQKLGLAGVIRMTGAFMIGVGVVSPLMVAIGYAQAGNALLFPTTATLILLGFVLVLQRFFTDVYGLVTWQGQDARDGLMAILFGMLLVLAALPLAALIWGARVSDLTELWTQFLQGFNIGGTQISPSIFLKFAIVFAIGYTVTRLLQATLRQSVLPKTSLDIGGQNAMVSGIGYVGIFLAALVAVTVAGLDLSGIAIVAGALSVGIGFGLQTIVSNFVSGIILLIERPVSEGDWIEVGGQMGYVRQISVRSTRIETFDRTDVIIPNSDLVTGTVTNYTRGNTVGRLIVSVGVAYGTDTKKVDRILREIAEAQPMVLSNPPPVIVFQGFGADSLDFEIRAILRDVNWMLSIKNDINHEIAARFTQEGIEIPFAQRDIWLRNPEVLRSRHAPLAEEGDAEDTEEDGSEAGSSNGREADT